MEAPPVDINTGKAVNEEQQKVIKEQRKAIDEI